MFARSEWQDGLASWYQRCRRDLPWRRTQDPYAIWVSEVMLQQTQVATVIPYYERWMARFPGVSDVAAADEDEVLSLWQGLGYYRRAKLLLKGAKWVYENGVPDTIAGWRTVPGVGDYTAAAIGSISQGLPAAVVDGNVERVFARFTAHSETGPALLRSAKIWADSVLDRKSPGNWNQALMELGATVCTPQNPKCELCPLEEHCVARQTWSVERYPAAAAVPSIVRQRHFVRVPYCDGKFGLRRIPDGEWWAGMWEFPRVIEGQGDVESLFKDLVGDFWIEALGGFRHQVTHHRIEVIATLVRCDTARDGMEWLSPDEISQRALPSPQRRVLALALLALGYEPKSSPNME